MGYIYNSSIHCIIVIYVSYVSNISVYTLYYNGGWPQKHVGANFMVFISG